MDGTKSRLAGLDVLRFFVTIFCGLLGVAMAGILEFPVLRLRDRWFPSRAAQVQFS